MQAEVITLFGYEIVVHVEKGHPSESNMHAAS
jgi:hypothetical protein